MKKILSVFIVLFLFSGFVNAQSKSALGFNAGMALPKFDFGDNYDTGFGGSAIFVYHTNTNFDITSSAGYLTWSGIDALDGVTFSSIPVLVGARLLSGRGEVSAYFAVDLGMHFTSSDGEINGSSISSSDSYFGYDFLFGLLLEIGKNMDLDFNTKYNIISTEGSPSGYVSANVGLFFGLN